MTRRIPLSKPDLRGNEAAYVLQAIRSTWISSTGEYVDRLERDFAELVGSRHALTVCNGTAALHLALLGLGIGPGDEVIIPSLTFVATANAVTYVGAHPVFADVDPETWCIDPTAVERAITARTRAVIPVHLYGHPCEMRALHRLTNGRGIALIEDAAEALFATYEGQAIGALGDVGAFSFYGNKILTCGEGGIVTTNDTALFAKMRLVRGQGMDPSRRYYFPVIGHNFRLSNVACAIMCSQLERKEEIVARRKAIFALYGEHLKNVPGIDLQPQMPNVEIAPWLFCITVDHERYGRTRDDLMTLLHERGIETRPFFIPLHQLPPHKAAWQSRHMPLPHTERISCAGMNLPTYPELTDEEIEYICKVISDAVRPE
jgi:perosamine synthetase